MVTISLRSAFPDFEADGDGVPDLIPAVNKLLEGDTVPQPVRDYLWETVPPVFTPDGPPLHGPSAPVAHRILDETTRFDTAAVIALASCVQHPDVLQRIAETGDPEAARGLSVNPFVTPAVTTVLDTNPATKPFAASRIAAQHHITAFITKETAAPDVAAQHLLDAAYAPVIADLLITDDVSADLLEEQFLADQLESWLFTPTVSDRTSRYLRAATLTLIKAQSPTDFVRLGRRIATSRSAVIDHTAADAVQAALDGAHLTRDMIVASYTPGTPSFTDRPDPSAGNTTTEPEADLAAAFDALGLGAETALLALTSGSIDPDNVITTLLDAPVETVADWIEQRLPTPTGTEAFLQLAGILTTEQIGAIAIEMRARPYHRDGRYESIFQTEPIRDGFPPTAPVADTIAAILGDDPHRWDTFAANFVTAATSAAPEPLGVIAANA